MKSRILILIASISLVAGAALAHNGEEHVMGTVTNVTATSITVKTTAKEPVTVNVVRETKFTMGKMAMKIEDLKVGSRVVIHAKEPKEGTLVADTVEFAAAAKTAQPDHQTHTQPSARQP